MGLDMRLMKKTYVENWDHMLPEQKYVIDIKQNNQPTSIQEKRVSYIIETVITWRKTNAIHNWFVQKIQNGVDDCKDYPLKTLALNELLRTINQTLKNPDRAHETLPTLEGFFFGSTEYDEYYYNKLKATKLALETLLKESGSTDYIYSSSW